MSGEGLRVQVSASAIKFYDQIIDSGSYTHSPNEINDLIKAGYIKKAKRRGYFNATDKLLALVNSTPPTEEKK